MSLLRKLLFMRRTSQADTTDKRLKLSGALEQNEDKQTIERQKKQGGIVFRLCRPAVIKLLLYECSHLNCSLLREIKNYLLYLLIKT